MTDPAPLDDEALRRALMPVLAYAGALLDEVAAGGVLRLPEAYSRDGIRRSLSVRDLVALVEAAGGSPPFVTTDPPF